MTPRARRLLFVPLLALLAFTAGCAQIASGLATDPYERAMREGRMSPGEYQRKRDQLERAAEGRLPPSPLPSRFR